jgi:hypothetical protein
VFLPWHKTHFTRTGTLSLRHPDGFLGYFPSFKRLGGVDISNQLIPILRKALLLDV